MKPLASEQQDAIVDTLVPKFAGTFSPETIARLVSDRADRLHDAASTSFLPIFTRLFSRERLLARTSPKGRP